MRLRALSSGLALLLLAGASIAVERPSLVPIPEPSLAGMDAAVAAQLAGAHEDLQRILAREDVTVAESARAFGELGRLYLAYDLVEAAAACFENAHELVPTERRWPYLLGVLQQNERRLEAALASLEAALALEARDLATLIRLGQVHLARDEPERASERFAQALALDPRAAAALAGRGKAAAVLGDLEGAVRDLSAALELQPRAQSLRYPLAQAYRQLGRLEDAKRELAQLDPSALGKAEPVFPDPLLGGLLDLATGAGVHLLRGQIAQEAGRLDDALAAYNRALEVDAESAPAHRALSSLWTQRGDEARAVEHLKRASELAPRDLGLALELGRRLGRLQRFGEAAEAYSRAVAAAPAHEDARFAQGLAFLLAERYPEALQALEGAVASFPKSLVLRHALARLLAACPLDEVRDGARALELAESVARERPLPEHVETVAIALAELGRFSEAAELERRLAMGAEQAGRADFAAAFRLQAERYDRRERRRAPWKDASSPR